MSMLDQLTPEQRKLFSYGAVGVVGVVAVTKLTGAREPATPAPTVTPIQPMPSTDAIGVGELGDYFSAFTDTLGEVTTRLAALEDVAAGPTPPPDPSASGPPPPAPVWTGRDGIGSIFSTWPVRGAVPVTSVTGTVWVDDFVSRQLAGYVGADGAIYDSVTHERISI